MEKYPNLNVKDVDNTQVIKFATPVENLDVIISENEAIMKTIESLKNAIKPEYAFCKDNKNDRKEIKYE